jgi:hypothetical protein
MTVKGKDYSQMKDEVPVKGSPLEFFKGWIPIREVPPRELALDLMLVNLLDDPGLKSIFINDHTPGFSAEQIEAVEYAKHMALLDVHNPPNRRGYTRKQAEKLRGIFLLKDANLSRDFVFGHITGTTSRNKVLESIGCYTC